MEQMITGAAEIGPITGSMSTTRQLTRPWFGTRSRRCCILMTTAKTWSRSELVDIRANRDGADEPGVMN